jgi:hypothetical protein
LGFNVAGLAKRHFGWVIIGFGAVTIFAFDVVHQMKAVIEVDEIGELVKTSRGDFGLSGDLRVTERALRDGRVTHFRADLRRSGMTIGAHQLRSGHMRFVAERRK